MAETMSTKWFENVFPATTDEEKKQRDLIISIGDRANADLFDKISLEITNPMTTIASYIKIFEAICDVVVEKEDEWDDFCLNVVDRFNIGYTTTSSDDDEKSGNFMVFMQYIDTPHDNTPEDENETDTIQLCVQWNAANIKTQSDILKDCMARGKKVLSDTLNIKTENIEYIMPMFCIIHDALITTVLDQIKDSDDPFSLNVAGLYTVTADKIDGEPTIFFEPEVSLKLRFKNDAIATGRSEDE